MVFARVNRFQGPPERIDDAIRDVEDRVLPQVKQMEGVRGFLLLVDRESGKSLGISLWESEEAAARSEEAASRLRTESATRAGGELVSVERYEVAVDVPVG